MLMLTRRAGEKIIIGDSLVTIEITEIRGGQVRIGIDAPRELSVHRAEVFKETGPNSLAGRRPEKAL